MRATPRTSKELLLLLIILQCTVIFAVVLLPLCVVPMTARVPELKKEYRSANEIFAGHCPMTVGETEDNETSAKQSFWSVLSVDNSVGAPLHVLVTARDRQGNRRHTGGDFFNALLSTGPPIETRIRGDVTDFCNGSYLITFIPQSTGRATVSIELWMTSRLVKMVRTKKTTDYILWCARNEHHGHSLSKGNEFLSKLKSQQAVGECRMDWQPDLLPHYNKSCQTKFPQKRYWYGVCEHPLSMKCHDLTWCARSDKMMNQSLEERKLVIEKNLNIQGDVQSVTISGRRDQEYDNLREPCIPGDLIKAKGHWLGKEWVNWDCSFGSTSKQKLWQCLTNRSLYLIGDSTIRQLHLSLLYSSGLLEEVPGSIHLPNGLTTVYVQLYNVSIRFHYHGLPFLTRKTLNVIDTNFTTDLLDAIPANGNEIIILSTIHHFVLLPPEGFRLRLRHIIDAIRRLRERGEGRRIPIVFRTANPRPFDSLSLNAYKIKWYNDVAIEMLGASKLDVTVYDIFDMVASSKNPVAIHQEHDMMSLQLSHIVDLICPEEK
jgi:hypothetical protein